MMRAMLGHRTLENTFRRIQEYSLRTMAENPLVTPTGRRYWQEQRELVVRFVRGLARDLGLDDAPGPGRGLDPRS